MNRKERGKERGRTLAYLVSVFSELGFDGAFGDTLFKFPLEIGEFEEARLMTFLEGAVGRRRSRFFRP